MYKDKEKSIERFGFITKILRSFFWLVIFISSIFLTLFLFKDNETIAKNYIENQSFKDILNRETFVLLIASLTISLSFVSALSRKYLLTKIITLFILISFSFILIIISASYDLSKDTVFGLMFENAKNNDIEQLKLPISYLKNLQNQFFGYIPIITIFITMAYASIANGTKKIRVSNVIMGVSIILLLITTIVIICGVYTDKNSDLGKSLFKGITNVKPVIFILLALSAFCGIFTVFSKNNE